jgi:transposase
MRRLGFVYKKPRSLPAQADEAKQAAFIARYEALMTGLGTDEMVVFSASRTCKHVLPGKGCSTSRVSKPATHGWFHKDQKTAIKATSGRKRLNIQGALDLETFQFTFVEGEKIKTETTRQMLAKLEAKNPAMKAIHVFLDNARYHHAKILQPWLESSERRIKLHFLPPYAPHLNPIEGLWGVMHKWVTHNRHYASFYQFKEAILGFFRRTLPEKWHAFTDIVTDKFRIISLDEYNVI